MSAEKKRIREKFRTDVFKRDGHKCVVCGRSVKDDCTVDAHHITDRNAMPNGGYVKENGITLCDDRTDSCHEKAEKFHAAGVAEPGFSPDELYKRIGSSYARAYKAAQAL